MPTRQINVSRVGNGTTATNYYLPITDNHTTANFPVRVPIQIKIKAIYVALTTAPGAAKSFTYELLKNGSATAITFTITGAATTTGFSEGIITYNEDDTLILRRTTSGSPTLSQAFITWVYDVQAPNRNVYMTNQSANATLTYRTCPYGWKSVGVSTLAKMPISGSWLKAKYNVTGPGAGNNFVINFQKNLVTQDGAGGTVDTTVTIADAATQGEWSGTLTCTQGDTFNVQVVPNSSPTVTNGVAASFVFAPTVDGESCFGIAGSLSNLPNTATTDYIWTFTEDSSPNWATPESTYAWTVPTLITNPLSFVMRYLYGAGNSNLGAAAVFTLRKNSGDTALTYTVGIGQQSGSDLVHSASYVGGDTQTYQNVHGSPGVAKNQHLSIAMFYPTGGKGAGNQGGKKGGGGGVNVQVPSGASTWNVGNAGLDIGSLN